jgi:glycerol-3-phosphate acyltransferase PlsY
MYMNFIIFGCLAYLLGSIPSAVWIGKTWYGIDVRQHGSNNAGATNMFRVLGKNAGISVLFIDIFKGFLAVYIPVLVFLESDYLIPEKLIHIQLVAAISAVLGHVFPIFAGFKGGKGVSTSLGIIIGIHPPTAFVCLSLFLIVFLTTKFVSFGAICSSIAFPIVLVFIFKTTDFYLILFSIFLSFAVIFAHRKNIVRLVKGEENKMNLFKK